MAEKEKTKKWGWFTLGGFRKDPTLTKADKRYYEKELTRGKETDPAVEREEREYRLIEKKIKEKKADWLGTWLSKFSEKGTWDLTRYRNKKDDWL